MSVDPLSALEVACGMPLGGASVRPLGVPSERDPAVALANAALPALRSGRCFVAFSGGLDSSILLAAATGAAERHGLAPPIPITIRFPDVPTSHEHAWQERVVGHLGLTEWWRIELAGEMDILGPLARELLTRHGPYWPANSHFAYLLMGEIGDGWLLTGEGGDELFAWWRYRHAAQLLARRLPLRPRGLLTVALALAPAIVRRSVERRRTPALPWLTTEGNARYRAAVGRFADCPWRWDAQLAWMRSRDDVSISLRTLERFASQRGVRFGAPLLDRGFLASMATRGGRFGVGERTSALGEIFGALLPRDVLQRRDKATFNRAFWGPEARAFARGWDGTGVDRTLVDPLELRRVWLSPRGDWRTADLMHRAWLVSQRLSRHT